MTNFASFRASQQDGTYPRPQLIREHSCSLDGQWEFCFDDEKTGIALGWHLGQTSLAREIVVPFPPESPASQIGDPSYHEVLWYRRELSTAEIARSGYASGKSLLLNFGAVDYRCEVWVNGSKVGSHEGGHVGFSLDITSALREQNNVIVLRVEDDSRDVTQPRGKQDWLEEPHVIWYNRTSGIWQPVWIEAVNPLHVLGLIWKTSIDASEVELELTLSDRPVQPISIRLHLSMGDTELGQVEIRAGERNPRVSLKIPQQFNGQGYEDLLWSPSRPVLIDATLELTNEAGVVDLIQSYLGIRSVTTASGSILLNERPIFVRAVLEQGYWPESHLAAPSAQALKREVELIKELGFNTARIHQKVEDPRFIFWADKLGLMLWGEFPATFEYSTVALSRVTREWLEVLRRDASHPSIVAWVPLNESWGVQHIANRADQEAFSRAMYQLTKAFDQSRPVISNDGWEHTLSDITTIHDYEANPEVLEERYRDADTIEAMLGGIGPSGRRMFVGMHRYEGQPIIVSEFGGMAFDADKDGSTWGYSSVSNPEEFASIIGQMCKVLGPESGLIGFCYTQLTDTMQEANGLLDENRNPKAPMEQLRKAITGS